MTHFSCLLLLFCLFYYATFSSFLFSIYMENFWLREQYNLNQNMFISRVWNALACVAVKAGVEIGVQVFQEQSQDVSCSLCAGAGHRRRRSHSNLWCFHWCLALHRFRICRQLWSKAVYHDLKGEIFTYGFPSFISPRWPHSVSYPGMPGFLLRIAV